MGIFDFFKKAFENERVVESEKEKIDFSDIKNWIEKKEEENKKKEKESLIFIEDRIKSFVSEAKKRTDALKNINIESKKAEEKLKSVTDEGRKKYLEAVEILVGNLEKLKKDSLEKFIEDINKVFLNFNKNSRMSYERATILIGKEMEDIKGIIRIFSKEIIEIFDENKKNIEFSKTIFDVESKLDRVFKTNKEISEIEKTIIVINKKIEEKGEENKKIIEDIEEIKISKEYLENTERGKNIKFLEEELEKNILDLKQIIDFRALSNFFHIFEEEMKIIKLHREDFQTIFKKDYGESILKLLNEANLNNETISEKVKQIKFKKENISKSKQEIKKDATQELYSETLKIILEIGNFKNEKEREEKRMEKLKSLKEEIIKEIEKEMEKLNINILYPNTQR